MSMRLRLPRRRYGQRPGGGRQTEVHAAVDHVLVLASDGNLQLVARRRQMQRTADVDERTRQVEGEPALEALWLDLGLLAQTLGVQERGEEETERENDDAARGGVPRQFQNRK
jgi:hypothetical protein